MNDSERLREELQLLQQVSRQRSANHDIGAQGDVQHSAVSHVEHQAALEHLQEAQAMIQELQDQLQQVQQVRACASCRVAQ